MRDLGDLRPEEKAALAPYTPSHLPFLDIRDVDVVVDVDEVPALVDLSGDLVNDGASGSGVGRGGGRGGRGGRGSRGPPGGPGQDGHGRGGGEGGSTAA